MEYNTINLRRDAEFEIRLSKGLHWVPFNKLGRSRYSNQKLEELNSLDQIGKMIFLNVYEAIQLFQVVRNFQESNDIIYWNYNGVEWQLHKSGKYAYETNEGCCASAAAWLNYVVGDLYPEKGYLHWIRPDGSGHVINYFVVEGEYYFVDMAALTKENAQYAPVENGEKSDYLKAQFYTGACIKSELISDFINFHRRIALWHGYEFSYLKKSLVMRFHPRIHVIEKIRSFLQN